MGILMTKFTFTANATTKLHREKKISKVNFCWKTHTVGDNKICTRIIYLLLILIKQKLFSPSMTHTCLHFSYLNLIHLL